MMCTFKHTGLTGFLVLALLLICGGGQALAGGIRHIHPPSSHPPPRPYSQGDQDMPFKRWSSADILKAFRDNRLEAADVRRGLVRNAPASAEGRIFLLPSLGNELGGSVSSYDSEAALTAAFQYYSRVNEGADGPAWWIFRKDNILLLISGKVPYSIAQRYENVLMAFEGP